MLSDGKEQFTIKTYVDDNLIRQQPIHDPFIHSTTTLKMSRWEALKAFLFGPKEVKVSVHVGGTHAVVSQIMQLDSQKLEEEERVWLENLRMARAQAQAKSSGRIDYERHRP